MDESLVPVVPRPAATLVLLRDTHSGMEVFMIRRSQAADFVSGAHAFPGGGVDAVDSSAELAAYCEGLDDFEASGLLGVERGGLAYWIAAIRECFEEAGLLLAHDGSGEYAGLNPPQEAQVFERLRKLMREGQATLLDLCREHKLRLAAGRLAYHSRWITQLGLPRRYDTRFFVAIAPAAQTPSHDEVETVDHVWIRPAEALEREQRRELRLVLPTRKTLQSMVRFPSAGALMEFARAPHRIPAMMPRAASSRSGRKMLAPDDDAYAEVGRLDPEGHGTAAGEIVPGTVVQLSNKVRRITAPNPGFATGFGTNTYILGGGEDVAVIDPGPPIDAHVEAVLAAAGEHIRWVLVTHTHMGHSAAAVLLKARTGAELIGMPPPPFGRQDRSFCPDRVPVHGERMELGGCRIRVIGAPGHASNHVCYLLEGERLAFTGDHIIQARIPPIDPSDGDIRAYLESLRRLQREDIAWFAPGHGFLMDNPQEMLQKLLVRGPERTRAG